MLYDPPTLDAKTLKVIDHVETLKGNLRHAVSVPRRWSGSLRRLTFARALMGSNTIEGYNVTVEDAIAAKENEEPLEAKTEAWEALKGYRDAMTYVLQLSDDQYFTYSVDIIRSLHFMMLRHDLSKNPGRWRPGSIFIRRGETGEIVYEGPDASGVDALVSELMGRLQHSPHDVPLVDAAMAHLNLTLIHPFSDGNGRMARCLQTLVLARVGTLAPEFSSIEEHLGMNTQAYYAVLAEVGGGKWQPWRDTTAWIRFCLTAHHHQATTLLRRTSELESLWNELEKSISAASLPGRCLFALADAAAGFKVRNATYRPIAEVSEQVASRDLKALVDAGFLVAHGEKRGRFYTATTRVQQIRDHTRERRDVTDPFA